MSRLVLLVKKNLLRFVKNPKTIGFIIVIPIVYYLIIGFIFGGLSFADTTTVYNVGWVNEDTTNASTSYYKLDYISEIIDENIDSINIINYSSDFEARNGLEAGTIISYIYFPNGFQESLENRSRIQLAFFNNDTSSPSITYYYNNLSNYFIDTFKVTNVSNGDMILSNINAYDYDGILVINEGFTLGLNTYQFVNMTYYYRNCSSEGQTTARTSLALAEIRNAMYLSFPNKYFLITTLNQSIVDAEPFEGIEYNIYFKGDTAPVTKTTVQSTLNQAIEGIINMNPLDIDLLLDEEPFGVRVPNTITYSAPGYLLYGPMTILSFVLVVLTGEKKDGIFKRLSSTQVKNWELILSNILSSILLIFMQFAIGAIILTLFGWDPIFLSVFDLILGTGITIFIFAFFLLAVSFALAPIFKDPDTAGGGVWIIIIPLAMLSGIFVPIELFGEGMKIIAGLLPPRWAVVALQHILLNGNSIFHPEVLFYWGLLFSISLMILAGGIKLFNKFMSPT